MKINLLRTTEIDVNDVIATENVVATDTFETMVSKVSNYLKGKFGDTHKASGLVINDIVCEVKVALGK